MSIPVPPTKAEYRVIKHKVDRKIADETAAMAREQAREYEGMMRHALRGALEYIQDKVREKDHEVCLWVAERYYGKAANMTKLMGGQLKLDMDMLGDWSTVTPTDIKVRLGQVMDAVTQGLIPVETGKTLADILTNTLRVTSEEKMFNELYGTPVE